MGDLLAHASSACQCQEKVLDPLGLELQVVGCVLEMEPRSSTRALEISRPASLLYRVDSSTARTLSQTVVQAGGTGMCHHR